jgi:5-methylcytosine-specific restriction protein A
MPSRAGTPCSDRACSGVVHSGVCGRCGVRRGGKDRAYDAGRGSASQRGYDATWQRVRRMHLANKPLCHDCFNEGGRVTIATEVHHIIAKRDGGTNEFENLMSLCKSHHSQRTAKGE